jgi:hypothetical protein
LARMLLFAGSAPEGGMMSKEVRRPICACGNPRCPLPKLQAILKIARERRPSALKTLLRPSVPPTLSAA